MNRKEALLREKVRRESEVAEYQFNIDCLSMALEEINSRGPSENLKSFASVIRKDLGDNIREQEKSQIMLAVINRQLEAENVV